MRDIIIAPSIQACDLTHLDDEVKRIEAGGADIVHFDMSEGIFVQNTSLGLKELKTVRKATKLPIDVHAVVSKPGDYIDRLIDGGVNYISIHAESTEDPEDLLGRIKEYSGGNVKAGIAFNPTTNPRELQPYIFKEKADYIVIVTATPGISGQKFNSRVLPVIRNLRDSFPDIDIEVDCGIDYKYNDGEKMPTVEQAAMAGANMIVAGSAVFEEKYKGENYFTPIQNLKAQAIRASQRLK